MEVWGYINLVQKSFNWWAFVKMVMNFRVYKWGEIS